MYRARLVACALVLVLPLPSAVRADEPPQTLELADGRFRVTLEWAEEPLGERWILDLGGDGGMFGSTDGGEAARLEVAGESAGGRLRAIYRANERVGAFLVTHLASGVTQRFPVSASGALDLDPRAFAAIAPAKVVPVLDGTRAVKSFLGENGGTITATDERGVKFTLTLPKGALTTAQEITMTPVSSLGGFPFTPGFVAAVQIEPDGLRLWKLATLKIAAPTPVPRAQEVTFRFRQHTKELFLASPVLGPGLSLRLARLTGVGVGRGTAAELAAQWQRIPTRPSDQLAQELAQAAAVKRRGGSLRAGARTGVEAGACSPDDQVNLKWNATHQKQLKSAKSCTGLGQLLDSYSDWLVQASDACPALKQAKVKVRSAVLDRSKACFDEAFKKCTAGKQAPATFNILAAYRALKALGATNPDQIAKIRKCVSFDLDFSIEITVKGPPISVGAATNDRLSATGKLSIRGTGSDPASPAFFYGTTPIGFSTGYLGGPFFGCTVELKPTAGGVFLVTGLGLLNSPKLDTDQDPDQDVLSTLGKDIHLEVTPGHPKYKQVLTCPDSDPFSSPVSFDHWHGCFVLLHHREEVVHGTSFAIRVWNTKAFTKEDRRSQSDPDCSESSTYKLIHKPQP